MTPATPFEGWILEAKPWGDGSSCPQECNIVCDLHEIIIVEDIETSTAEEICKRFNAYPRLIEERERLREALERSNRKLKAYVGVCNGDKELTDTIIPMNTVALASLEKDQPDTPADHVIRDLTGG